MTQKPFSGELGSHNMIYLKPAPLVRDQQWVTYILFRTIKPWAKLQGNWFTCFDVIESQTSKQTYLVGNFRDCVRILWTIFGLQGYEHRIERGTLCSRHLVVIRQPWKANQTTLVYCKSHNALKSSHTKFNFPFRRRSKKNFTSIYYHLDYSMFEPSFDFVSSSNTIFHSYVFTPFHPFGGWTSKSVLST